MAGNAYNENKPSKEFPFHVAIYRRRAEANAIVHLHLFFQLRGERARRLTAEEIHEIEEVFGTK